jgi:hypothetical protein
VSERVRLVEDGIVLLDFSGIRDPDSHLHLGEEARRLVAAQGRGNALVLTDVSDSAFTENAVNNLRDLARDNKPYVLASALVGLSALTRIVFRAIVSLSGREIRACGSRPEAIAWLLARRATSRSSAAAASPRKP